MSLTGRKGYDYSTNSRLAGARGPANNSKSRLVFDLIFMRNSQSKRPIFKGPWRDGDGDGYLQAYRFLVDGQPVLDPNATGVVRDAQGEKASLIAVS